MLDERFAHCRGDSRFERLYDGCRWAEGPVYVPAGRYVIWSDIPNERMLRWDEMSGHVGLFRSPSGFSNGNTLDGQGRLVTCEHGNRRVTRTEHDGTISVLADRFDGKQLNSPNDVVVRSDGSMWFTDPAYGIDSDYEGHQATSEIGACNVYRVDPATSQVTLVADDFERPNGLAFSLDETLLYIADTRRNHIRVFPVDRHGEIGESTAVRRMHVRRVRRHPPGRQRARLGGRRRGSALLRSRRHVDRQVAPPGAGSQPDVRRPATEPVVRHRYDVAVFDTTDRRPAAPMRLTQSS